MPEKDSSELKPELKARLSELWKMTLSAEPRPEPEFVLVGRLNEEGSVLIKLAGGDEAHCRSEELFLRERDSELWVDYAVVTFEKYKAGTP